MFSKILLKLLKEAVIPAVVVFLAKILSAFLLLRFYPFQATFTGGGITVSSAEDFLVVNSYSNFFTLLVIAAGLAFVLIRAHFFHTSHITPTLGRVTVSHNLKKLTISSWEAYHQGVVWLALAWLSSFFFTMQALLAVTFVWVPFLAFLVAINATWLFIFDLERELDLGGLEAKDDVQVFAEEELP